MRLLWTLFALALLGVRVAAQEPAGRTEPLIILIHGRDQAFQISTSLEREWLGALSDGLRKVRADTMIPTGARHFVQYQHVFEHGSVAGPDCPAGSTGLKYRRESFGLFASTAQRYFFTGPRNEAVAWVRSVANALHKPQILALQLPDVKLYHDNPPTRCETERLLHRALDSAADERRPVILVAHSMGALVSLRVLSQRPPERNANIVRFVTFGSQAGAAGMVKWMLGDNWKAQRFRVPSIVNLVGRDDHLAFEIGGKSDLRSFADSVRNLYVETNASDQHSFEGYLKHPAMAGTIADSWCTALGRTDPVCPSARRTADGHSRSWPKPSLVELSVALRALQGRGDSSMVQALGIDLRNNVLPFLAIRTNWHLYASDLVEGDRWDWPRLGSAVLMIPFSIKYPLTPSFTLFGGAYPGIGYLYKSAIGYEALPSRKAAVTSFMWSAGLRAFNLTVGVDYHQWVPLKTDGLGPLRRRAPRNAIAPTLRWESALRF